MLSSMWSLLVQMLVVAMVIQTASADFELKNEPNTIRREDRDPFKEGYFEITVACFALMIFFIGCMFSVRVCFGKRRGNDSKSFFLVA